MNDSVEIQSPPSKKFKQAEIAIETNSDNKDIEKENKPIDEDSPSVDDGSFIRSSQRIWNLFWQSKFDWAIDFF